MMRLLCGLAVLLCSTTRCLAADAAGTTHAAPKVSGLAAIDWAIIVVYALGTLGLGWYYSRKQDSTSEYFVGTGHMNPFLVGVSLFATLLSTISYLSLPGESLGKGPVLMLSLVGLPIVFYLVGFVLLPIYMRQRVTSAYELLEARLGPNIRLLGALMFIALRLVWMALLIYLTSKAMALMLGVGDEMVPVIAIATGLIAVIYTSMGGLRAVVITDLMQSILLYGGALLVLGTITYELGGFGWVPTQWDSNWDTQPLLPTDFSTRVTVLGTIVSVCVWNVCTLGGDQTSVQRFMATTDLAASRRALATQLIVNCIVTVTLVLVGFAMLGYFHTFPDRLAAELSLHDNADDIFPHFISYHLPPGISGLVIAAMFAAAMSSIDSGVNSITAVVMTDWLDRYGKAPRSEAAHVRTARWLAFAIGSFVVLASSTMGSVPGNITAVTQKTSNLLTTPIFGLFFFALFVPFASPIGVAIGTLCGTIAAVLTAFSGPIFGFVPGTTPSSQLDPISFQWIGIIALTVNIVTGCIASLVFPRRPED